MYNNLQMGVVIFCGSEKYLTFLIHVVEKEFGLGIFLIHAGIAVDTPITRVYLSYRFMGV